MKKLNLSAVMAAVVLFVACTDQAYNLGRIDTTVGTHVNIKLPVGSIGQIKFGDLIDFGEDNEILKTGEDGTYRLVMEGYSETFSIEVPDISIGPMSGYAEDEVLLPAILHGGSLAPDYTLVEKDVAVPCNLDFEKVIDNAFLRGIGLAVFQDTGFSCKFTVSTGKATLKAGATMTFPDYMELEAVDDNLTVTDGHIVTFAKDCISGQDIRLRCKSMDLRKLPEGQGVISMGDKQKLVMKAQVMLRGKVVARSGDFSPIPEKIHFNYLYEFSKAEIESIQLKCDLKGLVDDIPIDIEDTGRKFNEEGYRFDLANPCITLSVTNNSPVGISMSADVHCSAGGENYCSFSFSPDKMNFPAGTATDAFLSLKGTNHAAPAIDIVDTQMSGMFKKFPEMVEIADINITTDKEYFTVTPDMKLEFKVKAGIDTEVEFGPELKIPYNMVIDGFDFTSGDDIKCQVDEAKITFDIINSIPALITLDADATRLEGEDTYVPCDDIRLQVNGSVASGTLVNPSTNHIELVFSMDSLAALESVERITLNIVVEGNGSASEPLNMNQGIKVENIKAFVNGKVEGTL